MPGGWILPNDGYGCGYTDLDYTIQELHKRGFYTGLWTEKGLERIAGEVAKSGSRVMKLDVAWVGPGYGASAWGAAASRASQFRTAASDVRAAPGSARAAATATRCRAAGP